VGDEVVRDRCFGVEPTIKVLSWTVRGLNCPNKRGDVKRVLRRFSCDVAFPRNPSDVCDRGNEQGMEGLRLASHGPRENHTARVKRKARQREKSTRLCA